MNVLNFEVNNIIDNIMVDIFGIFVFDEIGHASGMYFFKQECSNEIFLKQYYDLRGKKMEKINGNIKNITDMSDNIIITIKIGNLIGDIFTSYNHDDIEYVVEFVKFRQRGMLEYSNNETTQFVKQTLHTIKNNLMV